MNARERLVAAMEGDTITLGADHAVWSECLDLLVEAQHAAVDWLRDPPSMIAAGKRGPAPRQKAVSVELVKRAPPPSDERIIGAIEAQPGRLAPALSGALGCSCATLGTALRRLEKAGAIRTEGTHRAKRYYPAKVAADDSDGHDHAAAAAALGAQAEDARLTIGGEQ